MGARNCDNCGSRMAPFFPRKRGSDGESLLCNACKGRDDLVVATLSEMGPSEAVMFVSSVFPDFNAKIAVLKAAVVDPAGVKVEGGVNGTHVFAEVGGGRTLGQDLYRWDGVSDIVVNDQWDFHYTIPGDVVRRQVDEQGLWNEAKGRVFWHPYDDPSGSFYEGGLHKHAHDSGDGETIYHCPFCGAGGVMGKSDGTAECQFCKATFTVQVQPSYSAVPQTLDGEPHIHPEMPGQEPGVPEDEEETEETQTDLDLGEGETGMDDIKPNPFTSRLYRTASGHPLGEADYIAHLGIKYAEDRKAAIESVKASRTG